MKIKLELSKKMPERKNKERLHGISLSNVFLSFI
jgi:hypothetical protein